MSEQASDIVSSTEAYAKSLRGHWSEVIPDVGGVLTRGKWIYFKSRSANEPFQPSGHIWADPKLDTRGLIATIEHGVNDASGLAMAAAPEMLAALKQASYTLAWFTEKSNKATETREAVMAAIAKAEGRAIE
jgi:hypothetical protein